MSLRLLVLITLQVLVGVTLARSAIGPAGVILRVGLNQCSGMEGWKMESIAFHVKLKRWIVTVAVEFLLIQEHRCEKGKERRKRKDDSQLIS